MLRTSLNRVIVALGSLFLVTGCTTTPSQVTQTGTPKKEKQYISEETPQTGSHIARRYSPDDAAPSANNVSGANASDIQRPQLGRGGN
jgi:hypothetical protein